MNNNFPVKRVLSGSTDEWRKDTASIKKPEISFNVQPSHSSPTLRGKEFTVITGAEKIFTGAIVLQPEAATKGAFLQMPQFESEGDPLQKIAGGQQVIIGWVSVGPQTMPLSVPSSLGTLAKGKQGLEFVSFSPSHLPELSSSICKSSSPWWLYTYDKHQIASKRPDGSSLFFMNVASTGEASQDELLQKARECARVLIVSGPDTIHNLYRDMCYQFCKSSSQVFVAASLCEAQKALQENGPFDLVMCDVKLGDAAGSEILPDGGLRLLHAIRQREELEKANDPVVFVARGQLPLDVSAADLKDKGVDFYDYAFDLYRQNPDASWDFSLLLSLLSLRSSLNPRSVWSSVQALVVDDNAIKMAVGAKKLLSIGLKSEQVCQKKATTFNTAAEQLGLALVNREDGVQEAAELARVLIQSSIEYKTQDFSSMVVRLKDRSQFEKYSIILLDEHLKDQYGSALLQQMRQIEQKENIWPRKVVISNSDNTEDFPAKIVALGANFAIGGSALSTLTRRRIMLELAASQNPEVALSPLRQVLRKRGRTSSMEETIEMESHSRTEEKKQPPLHTST